MSRTVSFRCSEALDEFLEQEAERRMTTKSSVAQKLLAERAKELMQQRSDNSESEEEPEDRESSESGQDEQESGGSELPPVFQECSDYWYKPDSDKNEFAVECIDGEVRYYKTADGAAERLLSEYQ